MIDIVEDADNIDVHQPFDASPDRTDGFQRRVAGPTFPELVARIIEDGRVDLVEYDPDHFLDKSVLRGRYAEWPHAAVGLGYQDTTHSSGLIRPVRYRGMMEWTFSGEYGAVTPPTMTPKGPTPLRIRRGAR